MNTVWKARCIKQMMAGTVVIATRLLCSGISASGLGYPQGPSQPREAVSEAV